MMKVFLRFLIFVLMFCSTSVAMAEGLFAYAGINYNRASINIDETGATSVEDEANTFKVFAASRLYKNLYLEYGYQDLGEYTASYDFTVGNFRFVESHTVDFSQSLYTGLVIKTSIGEMLEQSGFSPALEKVYVHLGIGATLWKADLGMEGELFDTGTLLGPYGATGDDIGLSSYYEFGLGYRLTASLLLTLSMETHVDVGKGLELQLLDGSKQEFEGRNVENIGIGITYMF